MADLSEVLSSQSVKIAGANPSSGVEDNYLEVDTFGRIIVKMNDGAGNSIASTTTTPAGTEQALVVRNIPSGTQAVSAASLPLPTGASTSALQTTGNSSLSSIDTKLPALGQALAAASIPIVLTAAQLITLTPLSTIAATQSGTWNITNVSGTVSLPTGASTAANQTTEITSLQLIDNIVHTQNTALVAGIPLMGQLDDTSTVVATEDNVSVARITAQRAIHSNLRKSDGTEMLGQKTMVNSIPVVLPSDQTITITSSPLPATGSKFAFGRITTAATPIVSVEQTTYTEQTTNGQRSIASASAADAAAGTGARTVTITYYDQTGAGPLSETLTLNGTTGVNTVNTNICFIENIKVATIGSGTANAGIITLFAAINKGGATIGTIAVGDNQTFWCHHYIPTGKTCFISGFSIGNNSSVAGGGGLFVLKAGTPTVANTVELQVGDFCTISGASSTNTRNYSSPIQVTGPARVKAYVTPYATAAVTQFASFDFIDN